MSVEAVAKNLGLGAVGGSKRQIRKEWDPKPLSARRVSPRAARVARAFAILCLLAAATGTPGTRHDAESWQVLHTVTDHDQWLTAVWARQGGTWFAGGKNVLLSGRDSSVKTIAMRGTVIYRFGEDSTGRVIAVGLRAMVWEQEGDGLRLVHQSASPARRGRAGYNELLYGIGYLDPPSADTLIAYGPNDLIAYRRPPSPEIRRLFF